MKNLTLALTAIFLLSSSTGWTKSQPVAFILVEKNLRQMHLVAQGPEILKTYTIALGWKPEGQKYEEGDERTPHGRYTIDEKRTWTQYHKALSINYPTPEQRKQAKKKGINPGGNILIHGFPNRLKDYTWLNKEGVMRAWQFLNSRWTDGCIAVTNSEMDEIYDLVQVGTPIIINE